MGVNVPSQTGTMKIAALSLLAFAFVGVNAHGANRCTWGPTYWCKSIVEAKECSAVQHCINHNWAHLAVTKNAGHACEICKLVVTDVRDIFSPEFEKDIEDKFALPLVSAQPRMFLLRSFPDLVLEMTVGTVPTSSATSKEGLRRKARLRCRRTSRECARSPDLTRECANNSSRNTWTRSSMLFPLLTPARSASSPECAKQRNINLSLQLRSASK